MVERREPRCPGRVLRDLGDLAVPATCAGCGRRTVALCSGCRAELGRLGRWTARPTRPDPVPSGLPTTWALAPYAGVLRHVIVAHKDDGRTALREELAGLWRCALAGALASDEVLSRALLADRLIVVPVPSSAASVRERGRDPWSDVVESGLGGEVRLPVVRVLRMGRRVRDQAGLGWSQRAENLAGAMALRRGTDPFGLTCVLTDDVMTTGATLSEGCRVLRAAGAADVVAVVIAATQRRGTTQVTPG